MMKGISIFLLLLAFATTSFAEEGKAGQAAVDQNAPIQSKKRHYPAGGYGKI